MLPESDVARIRTIKPEFWADEKLGPMDPLDRLVFLGLMSLADDAGRLIDSVKALDGALFPYTDDTCGPSLERLASASRIVRGTTASGQRVVQVANWDKHQRVDHPNLLAALPEIAVAQEVTPPSRAAREKDRGSSRGARASTNDLRPTTNDLPAARGGWLAPFIDLHREKAGEPAVGPMGKALKQVRDALIKEFPDTPLANIDSGMLALFRRWLTAGKAQYGVPQFARSWRDYIPGVSAKERASTEAVAEFLAR